MSTKKLQPGIKLPTTNIVGIADWLHILEFSNDTHDLEDLKNNLLDLLSTDSKTPTSME